MRRATDHARRPLVRAALLAVAVVLSGCASLERHHAGAATVVVIRHAEKVDDSQDPPLSVAGHLRAGQLATLWRARRPDAMYTTDFQRTRQTLAPLARVHGMAPQVYDARQSPQAFAATLRAAHPRGTIVVAGHSNTVPAIVTALCGCAAEAMADSEFDRVSTIHFDGHGRATLHVSRYGAPSSRP